MALEFNFETLKSIVLEFYCTDDIADYEFKTRGSTEDSEAILTMNQEGTLKVSASVQSGEGFLFSQIDLETGEPFEVFAATSVDELREGLGKIFSDFTN